MKEAVAGSSEKVMVWPPERGSGDGERKMDLRDEHMIEMAGLCKFDTRSERRKRPGLGVGEGYMVVLMT